MCFSIQFHHPCSSWEFLLDSGNSLTISTSSAAAESLQSCPTLCDPIDGSPPGSPVPGILQARTLEWVAIAFSSAWKWKVKGKSLSRVPMDCSLPGSSIHGIFQARALEWGASVKSLDLFLGFMRFSGNLGEKCSGGRGLSSNHILLSNGTSSLPLFQNV